MKGDEDVAGAGLAADALEDIRGVVRHGCAVAEGAMLPPQSRLVLPLIVLEHSAVLPDQAAAWEAALKVRRFPCIHLLVRKRAALVAPLPNGTATVSQHSGFSLCACTGCSFADGRCLWFYPFYMTVARLCELGRGIALQLGAPPCAATCSCRV